MTKHRATRRAFLGTAFLGTTAVTSGLAGWRAQELLAGLPAPRPGSVSPSDRSVQFDADIEPVVRLLEETPRDRVLEAVPWINYSPLPSVEVTTEEHKLKTDPETGEAKLTLKLKKGGV